MPKKVFELAKELELGPLDLVELLKSKGVAVRNHMSVLSDADVTSFLASYKKEKELLAAHDEPKKKVVRKKVISSETKTIDKKTVDLKSSDVSKAATKVSASKSSTLVVKKKTSVIRRKSDDKDSSNIEDNSEELFDESNIELSAQDHEVDHDTDQDLEQTENIETDEQDSVSTQEISGGLRVVSKAPPRVENEVAVAVEKTTSGPVLSKPFQDRVHRFTPVYTPSKDPNHIPPVKPQAQVAARTTPMTPKEVEDNKKRLEDEEVSNKKRLGGLASMMTGKKVIASKSQALNFTRAEDELKSYVTLSGTGRPIYSQVLRKRDYMGPASSTELTELKDSKRVIHIHKGVELNELAKKLSLKFKDLIDACLRLNLLIKETDYVGPELAAQICELFNYRVEDKAFKENKIIGKEALTDEEKNKFPTRPPVVAIMGHVDHGKTTLLDTLRKAKVAAGEAGGITQHIGAYSVKTESGKEVTFLDTPGHAAFASMRQRGANATDVVVLVVAADDGVMPQTKESIKFCENAGVPIIVAINKMDKPGANPDKVKQELTEFNLLAEDWGGQTQFVAVSALKGEGIDNLLDAILLQAEMLDLRANPKGNVEGLVIESKIEAGRGPMATILIQTGTLNKGDSIVVGETCGRARSLTDHLGNQIEFAGPSTPVQILGLDQAPSPGDQVNVVKNDREAKKIIENRISERKLLAAAPEKKKVSLEDFFSSASKEGEEQKMLNLIIRSDVQGSYEAIKQALETLGNQEVAVKVIAGGVGPITDSDVQMANTAGGFIIGFNMRPVTSARKMAEEKGVDIKNYSIIYELINDVKMALEGLLDPEFVDEFIGRAEVRTVFNIPKAGVIAGSYVIDGKIAQGCSIRLLRNGKIIHDGKMSSLKRFKDDAKEVKNGYECGIALQEFDDIKEADIFEAYMMIQKKRTLDDAKGMAAGAKESRPAL